MQNSELIDLIKVHRNSDELDYSKIWSEGLFVFDTNVFLDLYRLPQSARKDLMNVLENESFKSRIWIGFQVALEFLNNRYEAISDQKNKFGAVRGLVSQALASQEEALVLLKNEIGKLKLKQRHSLIDPDSFLSEKNIKGSKKYLEDFLGELETLEKKQFDVNDHDDIKDFVLGLMKKHTGPALSRKEIEDAYKEGQTRYEKEIPPGYKDKKKEGSYFFQDKEYVRKYGDLLLWKEIIKKAQETNHKYIVLITGDIKEDWWAEKRGKRLGPRKELLNEIYTSAPSVEVFHMYDTSGFLQYAKDYLDSRIKESSIIEAKDLIHQNRLERNHEIGASLYLPEILRHVANQFGHNLKIGIGKSVYDLPEIVMEPSSIYSSVFEIFSNAAKFSSDKYVGIQAKEFDDFVQIRFKSRKSSKLSLTSDTYNNFSMNHEGSSGLRKIRNLLADVGADMHIKDTDRYFVVEFYIPQRVHTIVDAADYQFR